MLGVPYVVEFICFSIMVGVGNPDEPRLVWLHCGDRHRLRSSGNLGRRKATSGTSSLSG